MRSIALPVMIVLHTGMGVAVEVNTEAITHLRNPEPNSSNPSFPPNVKCMVNLSDGKFVTVVESCREVRSIMENRKHKR
jgi:hypothetical protein